jgi:hypothetical protein
VDIGPAQTAPPETPVLYQIKCFGRGDFNGTGEGNPKRKKFLTFRDISTGKFTQHCRVHDYAGGLEKGGKACIVAVEVVDPDRSVNQDIHR